MGGNTDQESKAIFVGELIYQQLKPLQSKWIWTVTVMEQYKIQLSEATQKHMIIPSANKGGGLYVMNVEKTLRNTGQRSKRALQDLIRRIQITSKTKE